MNLYVFMSVIVEGTSESHVYCNILCLITTTCIVIELLLIYFFHVAKHPPSSLYAIMILLVSFQPQSVISSWRVLINEERTYHKWDLNLGGEDNNFSSLPLELDPINKLLLIFIDNKSTYLDILCIWVITFKSYWWAID